MRLALTLCQPDAIILKMLSCKWILDILNIVAMIFLSNTKKLVILRILIQTDVQGQ